MMEPLTHYDVTTAPINAQQATPRVYPTSTVLHVTNEFPQRPSVLERSERKLKVFRQINSQNPHLLVCGEGVLDEALDFGVHRLRVDARERVIHPLSRLVVPRRDRLPQVICLVELLLDLGQVLVTVLRRANPGDTLETLHGMPAGIIVVSSTPASRTNITGCISLYTCTR